MKIKVFANTNKLHLLSRCSCHVFYQEIDLLAFALCYVDDFVLFKFYLFFIRVTDLIIFHANTDTIFFSNYTKTFLVFNTFPTLHVSCFFFKYYVILFFINEHLIFLFMLYYLQFILEVITNNLMCKTAILWVHVSP